MSVVTYLENRARSAVLSVGEQATTITSISAIQTRLGLHFNNVSAHFRFGSSTRETNLPRSMDEQSDIDYMVVFADRGYHPQTYLDRLKRFAEYYYHRSDIKQSSPSVVLELNHIKFDLVPALTAPFAPTGYQIPAGPGAWQDTNPNDFNATLTAKNVQHSSRLKPAIRLLKFWNARNGNVFQSFALEKYAVTHQYFGCNNVRDYLFEMVKGLSLGIFDPQWKQEKLNRAVQLVESVSHYERLGLVISAESEVKKLIPG